MHCEVIILFGIICKVVELTVRVKIELDEFFRFDWSTNFMGLDVNFTSLGEFSLVHLLEVLSIVGLW